MIPLSTACQLIIRAYSQLGMDDPSKVVLSDLGYSLVSTIYGTEWGATVPWGFFALGSDGSHPVVVRGTSDLYEWIKNLTAILVPAPRGLPGSVEQGAASVYRSLYCIGPLGEHMHPADLAKIIGEVQPIGHSLGGTQSSWIGAEIDSAPTTFGEPRLQDGNFATFASLPGGKRRVVGSLDAVPDVPLPITGLPWQHWADPIRLHEDGSFIELKRHHQIETYLSLVSSTQVAAA